MITPLRPTAQFSRKNDPRDVLESVLAALAAGKISAAVAGFNDAFIFRDNALGLEFEDKARLGEFFLLLRQVFPENVLEVKCTYDCGEHLIAEWQIMGALRTMYYTLPHLEIPLPICFRGVSVVRIENGRVSHWSDYYDTAMSRRNTLAMAFKEVEEM